MLSAGEPGNQHGFLIFIARFNFSCSLIGNFRGRNSEEGKYWRKLMMKIAMRIIVLTLVVGAMNLGAGSSLSGPGPMPGGVEPPIRANL
jgi:hypothetical protein